MGNWPAQPPAGNLVIYLPYPVYFRDPAVCAAKIIEYNAAFLPGIYIPGVQLGPDLLVLLEGIDKNLAGWGVDAADKWIDVCPSAGGMPTWGAGCPYIASAGYGSGWLAPFPIAGRVYYPPDGSGDPAWYPPAIYTFDYTQDWFVVPGHPNIPVYGTGPDITYIWVGVFLNGGGGPTVPPTLDPMRPRRFIQGFEMPRGGEGSFNQFPGGGSGTAECWSRDASRTPDGIGLAYRQSNSTSVIQNLDQFVDPPVNDVNSWERFYMRIRALPSGDLKFWSADGSSANSAIKLGINSTGNLLIYTENNLASEFLRATSAGALSLNTWYRVDLYAIFKPRRTVGAAPPCEVAGATNGNQGFLYVYINKTLFVSGNGTCHDAFGTTTVRHDRSLLGPDPSTLGLEIDFDDWANMDPGSCTVATPEGGSLWQNTLDWLYGFHVQLIRPTGPGPGHAASWTNTYRTLLQNPAWQAQLTGLSNMSSGIASARLEMLSEMDGEEIGILNGVRQLGCLALVSGYVNDPSDAGTNGRIGFSIGGVDNLRTIAEESTQEGYASNLADIVSGQTDMPALSASEPMNLVHVHATDITTDNIAEFQAMAAFAGSWGPEDDDSDDAPGALAPLGIHNSPYTSSLLGRTGVLMPAQVAVATGTYVGNGSGQDVVIDINFVHWLYIRNTTTNEITYWWSSMMGPHLGVSQHLILPNNMVRLVPQPDGTCFLQLAGNHVGGNASGVTYQYVAFSDPMSKILLCGAWKHNSSGATNLLFDQNFAAEAGWFAMENMENTLSGSGIWFKGPGHAQDGGSLLNASAQSSSVARFPPAATTGTIVSGGFLHGVAQGQCAFAAFRQSDGSGGTNPVFIGQYTGNGAGNRTIAVDLGGRRPIFALVTPLNAASWVRDPTHASNQSTRADGGTTSTTAIRGGGVDQLLVGSTLNANLIVYNVFIIPSPSTGFPGNDGWDANEAGGLTEPGWDPDNPDLPGWPPILPPEGAPGGLLGCAITFGSGTDSGGGSGCGVSL